MEQPSDEIFNEIKEAAKKIWNTYDNTYGYVTEKVSYVDSLQNVGDNAAVFYRMFDHVNQNKMRLLLSKDATRYLFNNN